MSDTTHNTSLISIKTIIILILIGVFSLGAYVTLSGFSDELVTTNNGRAHAMSKSPNGFAGMVQLLDAKGFVPVIDRRRERDKDFSDYITVYTLPSPHVRNALDDINKYDATLIVLPKWQVYTPFGGNRQTDFIRIGAYSAEQISSTISKVFEEDFTVQQAKFDIQSARTSQITGRRLAQNPQAEIEYPEQPTDEKTGPLHLTIMPLSDSQDKTNQKLASVSASESFTVPRPDALQTYSSSNIDPIITDSQGRIILGMTKIGRTYILSDPDLLNNNGLKAFENAQLTIAIFETIGAYQQELYFDVSLHGLETSNNLIKTLFRPPFLAATLCMFAAGLLMAWSAFNRFGTPVREGRSFALGKQALADNSAELIRAAGREPHLAGRYADLISTKAAQSVGLPSGMGLQAKVKSLDKIGERSDTSAKLSVLRNQALSSTDVSSLLSTARDLYNWKQEITHERD